MALKLPLLGFTSVSEYSLANKKQPRKIATSEQALFFNCFEASGCGFKPAPRDKPARFDHHGVGHSFVITPFHGLGLL
jgi:hypothetical protein